MLSPNQGLPGQNLNTGLPQTGNLTGLEIDLVPGQQLARTDFGIDPNLMAPGEGLGRTQVLPTDRTTEWNAAPSPDFGGPVLSGRNTRGLAEFGRPYPNLGD
ncbi:MAG TPA: hypothetical protein VF398_07760, partial [bacterium]